MARVLRDGFATIVMNEVMMVPVDEFNRLSEYYQGQMTESALLNKAGRLAAEQHFILKTKNIPDSMAVRITKPMALEQGRLVKRVRTGTAAPTQYEGVEEPEGPVDAPLERLLKQVIKAQKPEVIEVKETPEVKKVKKERRAPKLSVKKGTTLKKPPKKLAVKKRTLPATPSPSETAKKRLIPKSLSDKATKTLKELGWIEGEDSPKGAAKPRKKTKKDRN